MQRFVCGTALLSCAVLVGCGPAPAEKARRQLIGKWEARPPADQAIPEPDDSNPLKAFAREAAKKLIEQVKFEAIFRDTGTGTIAFHLGSNRRELGSGNWKVTEVEGNRVVVELRDLDDQNPQLYPITLLDEDHFKFRPPDADQELTFTRVKEQESAAP